MDGVTSILCDSREVKMGKARIIFLKDLLQALELALNSPELCK